MRIPEDGIVQSLEGNSSDYEEDGSQNNGVTRRDFLKGSAAALASVAAPTFISYLGQSSPSSDKEFLEVRDGNFYMCGEEYTITGANYQTRDYPWRMFKEYHPESIDKELDIAEELGVNSLRVPITVPYATKGSNYDFINDPELNEEYFENFDDFLDIANQHNLKVMPIMFDQVSRDVFKPQNFSSGEKYLEKWVPEFAEDERILAWDIINEPDVIEFNLEKRGKSEYKLNSFTREIYKKLKDMDKKHPVTVGTSDVSLFKKEKELMDDLPRYIDHEDFGCIHFYIHPKHLDKVISKTKSITDKPIVMQEFGLPTTQRNKWHTKDFQKKYYNAVLEKLNREDLEGSMFWKLSDHPKELKKLEIDIGGVYGNDHHNPRADDFGILNTDYSKKPAAYVVEQYFNWIM